jgi:hypothetical protein
MLKLHPIDLKEHRLEIVIATTRYLIRPMPWKEGRAYKLRATIRGKVKEIHVAETSRGPSCDCGCLAHHHEKNAIPGCRHVRALVAFGLISLREGQ